MIVDLQVNLDTPEGAPVDPEALIQGAKNAGLDGVLLTKENALVPDVAAYRSAGKAQGLAVFGGAKIATNHGIILCILSKEGESLPDDFAAKVEGIYDANSVIDAIETRGGVTIALRPYDRDVPRPMGDHLFSLQGLSACEVQNGRLPEIANDLALEAASNMEMPCVGSSCADGLEGIGSSATLFRSPVASEAELCEAIRKGDCWPVSFSLTVPAADQPQDRGGFRDRDRDRDRDGGRSSDGGRRRGRRGGRRRRDGQPDRGGGQERAGDREGGGMRARSNGEGRGGRGGRGRRGRRGGGGGGGDRSLGPRTRPHVDRPDDFGNRAPPPGRASYDEDFGNVLRPDERSLPNEDIGNRLRPGEKPLFGAPAPRQASTPMRDNDDDDDNVGNR